MKAVSAYVNDFLTPVLGQLSERLIQLPRYEVSMSMDEALKATSWNSRWATETGGSYQHEDDDMVWAEAYAIEELGEQAIQTFDEWYATGSIDPSSVPTLLHHVNPPPKKDTLVDETLLYGSACVEEESSAAPPMGSAYPSYLAQHAQDEPVTTEPEAQPEQVAAASTPASGPKKVLKPSFTDVPGVTQEMIAERLARGEKALTASEFAAFNELRYPPEEQARWKALSQEARDAEIAASKEAKNRKAAAKAVGNPRRRRSVGSTR